MHDIVLDLLITTLLSHQQQTLGVASSLSAARQQQDVTPDKVTYYFTHIRC